jgi:hypothetical protein
METMTQEDKELLIKDLCARLPYGVKMNHIADDEHSPKTLIGVAKDMITLEGLGGYECVDIKDYKPYLFPLSSMTEEQFNELKYFAELNYETDTLELVEWENNYKTLEFWLEEVPSYCVIKVFDWLNKNHFDYRGLIEKGLAIDATGLKVYR